MKKVIICAFAAAALASCSKNENNLPEGDNTIRLSAGVPSASVMPGTKAPVTTGTFTAGVAGWETKNSPTYSDDTNWATTAGITVNTTAQDITLAQSQTYNADNAIKTFIKSWYPTEGTITSGKVSFANATGEVDAMLAATVSGSKSARISTPLAFAHKTTQFVFQVAGESTLAAGTTLTSITVRDAQLPTGFDLTKEAATEGSVTYADAAGLSVPGISNLPIPIAASSPATSAVAGRPVMIKPMSGNKLYLDIVTSNATYTNVEATIATDTDFQEGKAYTITLTFRQTSISLTATVAQWNTGTGTGAVE